MTWRFNSSQYLNSEDLISTFRLTLGDQLCNESLNIRFETGAQVESAVDKQAIYRLTQRLCVEQTRFVGS